MNSLKLLVLLVFGIELVLVPSCYISATCNKAGFDLHEINLSRSTLHKKRYRTVENYYSLKSLSILGLLSLLH